MPGQSYIGPMTITSPCSNVCRIDEARQICIGCGRTLDEIAMWTILTDAERSEVMARVTKSRLDRQLSAIGES